MNRLSRRAFIVTASAATFAAVSSTSSFAAMGKRRVFVGSNTKTGILAFDWDAETGELAAAGVAAKAENVDWIVYSHDRKFLFAASEIESFDGKPTGAVLSFRVENGALTPLSQQNSASDGTCHIALDQTGRVLISADYGGGAAASFLVTAGKLSPAVWTEHYKGSGPVAEDRKSVV
jgi:6-phosphogluconolactonase